MLVLASLAATAQAQVSCFVSADPVIHNLQVVSARDAKAALGLVQAQINATKKLPVRDNNRMASLLAVQAQSYGILELDVDARESALAGLALVPDVNNPTHVDLLSVHAENVYDHAGIDREINTIEAARALLKPDSDAEGCLRISLGTLQYRRDRADLAVVNLMHAYQTGVLHERVVQRMIAASALSKVMRDMGDFTQALALNAEVIEWNIAQDASLSLSVTRFLRGSILKEMRDFTPAIEEFTKARQLSVDLDDSQGIAFADMDLCEVRIELSQLTEARQRCENALRLFTIARSNDVVKRTRAGLAHIDLEEGHTARALKTLNEILQNGAADMSPRDLAPLFKLRARANAAMGNFRESYDDIDEALRRALAAEESRRVKQAATLSARFETDRQLERNAELNRELVTAQERQRDQKRWTAIALAIGAFVIIVLAIQLNAIRRQRRQLALLANTDGLTGLPNRRHTYELALAEMVRTTAARIPLTVAIIDLDHFKSINDRLGHAAGDKVLRDFAAVCRQSIRDADIFGRWGGEEFLLVMPGTTLDVALIALERLRTVALGIELPVAGAGLRVALSAGLAAREPSVKTLDELIARADTALYKAKHEGRDLVRIDEESFSVASSGVRRQLR